MIELELTHTIDAAHRVVNHPGKCARLHGHTYKFVVRVLAERCTGIGFVVDFGTIKGVLDVWDHRTLLWDDDPLIVGDEDMNALGEANDETYGIIRLAMNPTSENLAGLAAAALLAACRAENEHVRAVRVSCSETPKSVTIAEAVHVE
jgi:6-pyruvoyltetrahydropterin/6-carboxytetrahydropterin synthase